MKDIFKILQEEKNRILEMHESATKNQYLGEQVLPVAPSPYQQYASIPDLSNQQLGSAVANLKNQPVPKSNKASSYTTQNWNQFSTSQVGTSLVTRGISKGAKFEVTNDPFIITAKNINVFFRDGSNWVKKPQMVRISFYCKQGKFYIQGEEKTQYVSETLSKALVKYVCGYKPTTKQAPKTEQPKTEQPKTEQPKTELETGSKTISSGTQVSDLNKQIQQSLGITPTGNITAAEIDSILVKLG